MTGTSWATTRKRQAFVFNFISMLLHCTVSKISHKTQLLYMCVFNTTINIFRAYFNFLSILSARTFE
jgi:hypothetical protein